ncbi:MAG: hypothetical protein ACKVOR_02050 [Flavobacteriales bacterium]
MLHQIQHRARYNNVVKELLDQLPDFHAEMGVYSRLLAMESTYKEWTQQQSDDSKAYITDDMLTLSDDACTQATHEITASVLRLLYHLDDYWRTTAEVNVEEN